MRAAKNTTAESIRQAHEALFLTANEQAQVERLEALKVEAERNIQRIRLESGLRDQTPNKN